MSGGGGGFFGGHAAGARANPAYYKAAATCINAEVKERGIGPMPEKPCNCITHIVITALVCTVIFMIVWELT